MVVNFTLPDSKMRVMGCAADRRFILHINGIHAHKQTMTVAYMNIIVRALVLYLERNSQSERVHFSREFLESGGR